MKTMKKQILFACLTAIVLLILSGALLIRRSVSAVPTETADPTVC